MKHEMRAILRQVTFTVSEVDPVSLEYGTYLFTPDTVQVETVGGVWTKVILTGPRRLKSGKTGLDRHSRDFWASNYSRESLPDWAEDLIKAAESVR